MGGTDVVSKVNSSPLTAATRV